MEIFKHTKDVNMLITLVVLFMLLFSFFGTLSVMVVSLKQLLFSQSVNVHIIEQFQSKPLPYIYLTGKQIKKELALSDGTIDLLEKRKR